MEERRASSDLLPWCYEICPRRDVVLNEFLNMFRVEEFHLLGYNAAKSAGSHPTFRRNISPPSSGLNSKPGKPCLLLALCWCPAWLTLQHWRLRWLVPLNRWLTFNRLHDVLSQKNELFITTALRTLNPISVFCCFPKINWNHIIFALGRTIVILVGPFPELVLLLRRRKTRNFALLCSCWCTSSYYVIILLFKSWCSFKYGVMGVTPSTCRVCFYGSI
jgi:hypothetical protein